MQVFLEACWSWWRLTHLWFQRSLDAHIYMCMHIQDTCIFAFPCKTCTYSVARSRFFPVIKQRWFGNQPRICCSMPQDNGLHHVLISTFMFIFQIPSMLSFIEATPALQRVNWRLADSNFRMQIQSEINHLPEVPLSWEILGVYHLREYFLHVRADRVNTLQWHAY